jgi:hypothetical protein
MELVMILRISTIVLVTSFLGASSCWKIKNHDNQALCEAKFEHKKHCWKIRNDDLRAYCEAVAEHKRSCWKIKENDLKAMCESEKAAL